MKITRERLSELLLIGFAQYDNVVFDLPFIECYHEALSDFGEQTIKEAIKRANRDRGRVFAPKTGELLAHIDDINAEARAALKSKDIRRRAIERTEEDKTTPERRKQLLNAYRPLLNSIGQHVSDEERRKAVEEVKARIKSLNVVRGNHEQH